MILHINTRLNKFGRGQWKFMIICSMNKSLEHIRQMFELASLLSENSYKITYIKKVLKVDYNSEQVDFTLLIDLCNETVDLVISEYEKGSIEIEEFLKLLFDLKQEIIWVKK